MSRKFLTALDLSKNELQNAVVQNLAAAPSSPVKGQLYFDSTGNILYWWNGTAWVSAAGGSVAFGTITQEQTFGAVKSDGVAVTAARSDHAHGNPLHDNAAHSTIPVNVLAAATGTLNMNSQSIGLLADPTVPTDAANKKYVDAAAGGLSWKDPVRVATTANITLSAPQTIDGVAVTALQRVLVKNQTVPAQNGIYTCAAAAWSRAADNDIASEIEQTAVFVMEGTTQADTAWVCTADSPITVDTTALTFVQFGSSTIAANSVDNTELADMPTLTIKGNDTGSTADPKDLTVAQMKTMFAGAFARVVTVGSSAGTSTVVTHSLGSNVIVQVYRASAPNDLVDCDVERTSASQATIRFASAVSVNDYWITVMG